ncbi:MAG: hypothetical protein IJ060_04570 [Oscillospiraceae bacterium]|nr:hypothetical protein [Oscillospiraceae bacterium]
MSACYFLGVKKVTSKKSGKVYFPCTLLSKNSWGDWETFHKFCDSEAVYQDILENVFPGMPVVVSLDMTGSVLRCVPHDSFPPLELYEEGGV